MYCQRDGDCDASEFGQAKHGGRWYHVLAGPDDRESFEGHRIDGIEPRTFYATREKGGRWNIVTLDDRTKTFKMWSRKRS